MEEVGGEVPVIAGVRADSGHEAALWDAWEKRGRLGLLIFPPAAFARGSQIRPEMAIAHFRAWLRLQDLSLIAFQYEMATDQGYPLDTLTRLAEEVPTFRAIKDRCNHPALHERQIRVLQI